MCGLAAAKLCSRVGSLSSTATQLAASTNLLASAEEHRSSRRRSSRSLAPRRRPEFSLGMAASGARSPRLSSVRGFCVSPASASSDDSVQPVMRQMQRDAAAVEAGRMVVAAGGGDGASARSSVPRHRVASSPSRGASASRASPVGTPQNVNAQAVRGFSLAPQSGSSSSEAGSPLDSAGLRAVSGQHHAAPPPRRQGRGGKGR